MVATGQSHTLILAKEGQVYSCGSNDHGQLGLAPTVQPGPVTELTCFSKNSIKIVDISAGEKHSAFVTQEGRLYVCGSG